MTACIMAGSFTRDPLVYPSLRKIMLPMKDLSGREICGVQGPSSSVSALHHQPYEVKGRGSGGSPIGEFVGTRTPPKRIYRRRIPPEIFDALPESAVDPPTSGDDDHEGVNLGLSKGDHWRHGDGRSSSPIAKPPSLTYGRTITVTGSPIKNLEKTYFGERDLRSVHAATHPDRNQQSGASDVRSSSPNSASQILRCQQCLGGTVFGVYQTPTASRKSSQATTCSSKDTLRKTSVPSSPASTVPHTTSSQVPFDQRRRESVPERRYRPVYYGDPRYRHRFERFNYGYSDTQDRPSSREIAVSGLQEFCRTMLTVKNCPVDYHNQEKQLTHSSLNCSPNQVNSHGERGYHHYDHTIRERRDAGNVKHSAQERNGSLQKSRTQEELEKQEQVRPSPTLRSPKLVKEILKKMSSQPSGQISHSELANYSDDDENFLESESKKPDSEAMRIMDEFDKALGTEDKSSEQDYDSPETVHSKNEFASQPKSENTKKVKKEHESQSDNLIEELVLSGHKVKQPTKERCVVPPGNHDMKDAEVTSSSDEIDASVKQETQKRVESPAPQKPPRNFEFLPRGFKQSNGEASFDQVSSGVLPLNTGSLDVGVQPNSTSVDSGVCSPQQNYFVVVAIDFGTTYSGYAFSFTRDPENIHMMRKWEGGDPGLINQKTPTTLLLTPDEKFHSFGYAARDCYHDLDQQEAKKWLYFEKFKMTLHRTENLNRDTCIAAANGRGLPAVTVFAHALRYFKDHTLQELSDQSATPILNEDIRWVVTVPAIWRQPAKQFMRSAAYEAGIASPDVPEQLMIALEPEAASIFCRRLQTHQLVPSVTCPQRLSLPNVKETQESNSELVVVENTGTRYMVVDCGGGTVDITVHEIVDDRGTIKELHKATGGPHGSVGIDMEFEKLLNEIFGADFMEQFKIKRPAAFVDLMIAFEARKRNASPFKITPLNISLPFSFIDYYKKTKGSAVDSAIKKYGNKEIKWSSQGMLRLEPTCMQRLFQPTLGAIKQHIAAVLNHPQVKNLEYLFLVGGFSESQILQKSIRDAFSSQLRVIIPQGVSLAILKGAVQFGLDPTVVTARRSRLTYGVGVLNRFVHGFHPKEKLVVKDGVEWCADIFDKFVVSDQSVCVGDMVIRKYTPARVGQACSVIHIYCSEKEDVNFITDQGVQRCGTLILDLSDCNASDSSMSGRREIETVMIFGDTELKVSAVDVFTGKCVKAEVDFFNQ